MLFLFCDIFSVSSLLNKMKNENIGWNGQNINGKPKDYCNTLSWIEN